MDAQALTYGPSKVSTGTATNAAATVTVAAIANKRHLIVGGYISMSGGTPTAAVATVKSAATTLFSIAIPAVDPTPNPIRLPIPEGHAIPAGLGEAVTLNVPDLGASILVHCALFTVPTSE